MTFLIHVSSFNSIKGRRGGTEIFAHTNGRGTQACGQKNASETVGGIPIIASPGCLFPLLSRKIDTAPLVRTRAQNDGLPDIPNCSVNLSFVVGPGDGLSLDESSEAIT